MTRPRALLRMLAAVAAVAAASAAVGRAADLGVTTAPLGTGSASVQGCLFSIPTSGSSLSVGMSDRNNGKDPQSITTVTISGFPGACASATLSASLTNTATAQNPAPTTGQGSCAISAGAATCSISPAVPLSTGQGKSQTSDLPLTLALAVAGGPGSAGAGSLSVNASGLVAGTCPAITAVTGAGATPGEC